MGCGGRSRPDESHLANVAGWIPTSWQTSWVESGLIGESRLAYFSLFVKENMRVTVGTFVTQNAYFGLGSAFLSVAVGIVPVGQTVDIQSLPTSTNHHQPS